MPSQLYAPPPPPHPVHRIDMEEGREEIYSYTVHTHTHTKPSTTTVADTRVSPKCTQGRRESEFLLLAYSFSPPPHPPTQYSGCLIGFLPSVCPLQRKPMFVYLHHDGSVLSNVFCSQLLCKESIVSYLSMNFITWAWDLTSHVHRLK